MSTTSYISGIIHDTKYIIGVMSLKRYRYRAYPKKGQKQPIAALFGCVRVVYNDALAYSEEQYKDTEKKPSSKELSARLTHLKQTFPLYPYSSPYGIWVRRTLTFSPP